MKKFIKENWFSLLVFGLITILSYFFVYAGDDWFWASNDAVSYLKNGFRGYNGRFISNIVIMLLTRSLILKCLFYGIFSSLLIFLSKKIINKNNNILPCVMIILFLCIDSFVLKQGYLWASGFVNFFITIVFLLYFMYLNIKEKYSKINPVVSFIMGIVFSLFLENVAILLLLINIGLVVYSKIKKNKKYNLGFLIGNFIGTIAMFSNIILFKSDYSDRAIISSGLIERFSDHIVSYYFGKGIFIHIILIFAILIYIFINRKKLSKINFGLFSSLSLIYLFANLLCTNNIINSIILVIYVVYSFVNLIKVSNGDLKKRFVWYFIYKVGYIAPLIFVDALGPRLLLFPFIIDIMIILEILNLYEIKYKSLNIILPIISIALIGFQFSVYIESYKKADSYNNIIMNCVEGNNSKVYLPYKDYTDVYYYYLPDNAYFQKYYIEFYDMVTDLEKFDLYFYN